MPDTHAGRPERVLGGRYELGEILGRGGMSVVHRGFDRRTGREVAVKVFRPGSEDLRYRREIVLLSGLNDPGLVKVFDADLGEPAEGDAADPDATPYLVTELVDGPTLAQRIRDSILTEGDVARLGVALCRTLGYVHGHGIVHRDVKPANILLPSGADDPIAMPKLVDFGIAVVDDQTRLTSHDLTVGTPNYLSPEQVRGEAVTSASDIYSLGLVLIEALTGGPAYSGGTGIEVALARLNRAPTIPEGVSPPLRAALREMTAERPADRPDAGRAATALSRLAPADGADTRSTAVLPVVPLGRPPVPRHSAPAVTARRRRRTFAAAGALAAGVAALVTIAATSGSPERKPPSDSKPPQQAAPPSERLSTAKPASTLRPVRPAQSGPGTSGASPPPSTRPASSAVSATTATAGTTAAQPRSTEAASPTQGPPSSAPAPSPSATPPSTTPSPTQPPTSPMQPPTSPSAALLA